MLAGPESQFSAPSATLDVYHLQARGLCRGKLTVVDPASVRGLALSVGYRGGLIVYVNGREVHREHIAQGQALAQLMTVGRKQEIVLREMAVRRLQEKGVLESSPHPAGTGAVKEQCGAL